MASGLLIGAATLLSGCPGRGTTVNSGTISGDELKQLNDADLARRLLGAAGMPFRHAMRLEAEGVPMVVFASDPKPSESGDLCEFTQLHVQLRKAVGEPGSARYTVTAVSTGRSFLVPDKPMRLPRDLMMEDWPARVRDCASRGPAIAQNKASPEVFKVWGELAGAGTASNAALAMRVLQVARTTFAAQGLPTAHCIDAAADKGASVCTDPRAVIAAALAREPGDYGLAINRCGGDPARVCIDVSDWPNQHGAATVVSLETDAKSLDLLPEDAAITGVAIQRRPVHVL